MGIRIGADGASEEAKASKAECEVVTLTPQVATVKEAAA